MTNQESTNRNSPDEKEIDLGIFLTLLVRIFRKIGSAIGFFFGAIVTAFLDVLLFLKRKFVWLFLGGALGLGLAVYSYYQSGPEYYTSMVVRTNFESNRLLYNKIEYFNSLVKEGRSADLAAIFKLPVEEAQKLRKFTVEAIDNELQKAKIYKDNFLIRRRNTDVGMDTAWSRMVRYKEFKEELTDYDYPMHEIGLYSSSPNVYQKVQEGIILSLKENSTLNTIRNEIAAQYKEQERILESSLRGIDSLRQVYNKRIGSIPAAGSTGTSLVVSERDARNPEVDLYDKELMLKDELMDIRRRALEQHDIIQVYSDFNDVGTRVSAFKKSFVKLTAYGIIGALMILVIVEILKQLNAIERSKKLEA